MHVRYRPSRIEVSPDAIRANVAALVDLCGEAAVCAVVKADGYGHGLLLSARAALEGGATMVAVATVEEAETLRDGGVDTPVMLLSEPFGGACEDVVRLGVECVVYSSATIDLLAAAAANAGAVVDVHLKVDTGMNRVGCRPGDATALALRVAAAESLTLRGLCTHFAAADDPGLGFTKVQFERFLEVDREVAAAGLSGYVRHAANSAAALQEPDTRLDLVRCGIACYGIDPMGGPEVLGIGRSGGPAVPVAVEPALRVVSAVSFVKRVAAGESVSYGCRFTTDRETTIVTVPIGYADGIDRRLGASGGEVLIRGVKLPIAGTVTMDQITVDAGDLEVSPGDEVVLIGRQGNVSISANEVAERLGTIGYEVVARLGQRLHRTDQGAAVTTIGSQSE